MPCERWGDYVCEITPLVPTVRLPGIWTTLPDALLASKQIADAERRIRRLHLMESIDFHTKWDALGETSRLRRMVTAWLTGNNNQAASGG